MSSDIWMRERKVAYFSMEIGHDANIPNYAGGLGILAGDTLKSCADLRVPIVGVTLLSESGFFRQVLDEHGNQTEEPEQWDVAGLLKPVNKSVVVSISGRDVVVRAWIHRIKGVTGFEVPVIYLDTNRPENSEYDKQITQKLYGGDHSYRLAQEVVLGIAGFRIINDMGYTGIERYHLNEGHGSFVILEMLNDTKKHTHEQEDIMQRYDFESVKGRMVFTTHTPVSAGHDKFDPNQVKAVLGDSIEHELIDHMTKDGEFNMTHVALESSNYVNGVAKKHAEVSRNMFPEYSIHSITNGVHADTWVSPHMKPVFDKYARDWFWDPASLRFAKLIPTKDLWEAHMRAKEELINFANERCGSSLSKDVFTIGYARRATPYKRLHLMFSNIDWLKKIHEKVGKVQFILAGKAHASDGAGKDLIRQVFSIREQLKGVIEIVYLENYNIDIAKKMVAGVDIWLNTPQRPLEASGTSGMKASHNGVPQMSTLDGWWIEGCLEDVTGWSIGGLCAESNEESDAADFYTKLEKNVLPLFYKDRHGWANIMRNTIAFNASYFNTHRMVKEYVIHAYFDEY